MEKILVLLSFFILNICTSFAADLSVEVNPPDVIKGEAFTVTFSITSEDGDDPDISFNPLGVEVISRNQTGVSTRTTYINGKLSVERKITVEYEMVSNALSYGYLRDIKVEVAGKVLKHPTVRIQVLSQPRQNPAIFALAVIDKSELFVKESLLVRYYLYNKVPISSYDIKKFPQLNKFLKRYHQERTNPERVEYKGEIYTRRIIYTAQVFAEKSGKYKIDPITLYVQYPYRQQDPFSNLGLGMGFRSMRNKTVRSNLIEIEAKELPSENVPSHFTGLVGKHEFKLKLNKSKFLVNEPVEVKFAVKGTGALEIFEAPKLLSNSSLEEFESNSDLKIDENFQGTKTFDMTYLGREAMEIKGGIIPLSYFDPEQMKFVTVNLQMDAIKIYGEAVSRSSNSPSETKKEEAPSKTSSPATVIEKPNELFLPIYRVINTYRYQSRNINIVLLVVIFIFGLYKLKDYVGGRSYAEVSPIRAIKKEGVTYSNLHGLISLLNNDKNQDMLTTINESNLSKNAKDYFIKLVLDREAEFKQGASVPEITVNKKYLSEFEKLIRNKNENIS